MGGQVFQVQGTPEASLVLCLCMCVDAEGSGSGKGQGETLEIRSPDQDRVHTHPFLKNGPERKGSYKDPNMYVLGWQLWKMVCVGLILESPCGAHRGKRRGHVVQRCDEEQQVRSEQSPNGKWMEKRCLWQDHRPLRQEKRSHALHKGGTGRGDNQFLGAMEIVGGAEIHWGGIVSDACKYEETCRGVCSFWERGGIWGDGGKQQPNRGNSSDQNWDGSAREGGKVREGQRGHNNPSRPRRRRHVGNLESFQRKSSSHRHEGVVGIRLGWVANSLWMALLHKGLSKCNW